jgi:hypothetical protein
MQTEIIKNRLEYLKNQSEYSLKMFYKSITNNYKGCCSNCHEDYNYIMNLNSVFDNAIFCYTCDSYQELTESKINSSFKFLIEMNYMR